MQLMKLHQLRKNATILRSLFIATTTITITL